MAKPTTPYIKSGRPTTKVKQYQDFINEAALREPATYGYLTKKARKPKELKAELSEDELAEKLARQAEAKRKYKEFHI